jgi:glucose-6-phosphate 1-dehydrogenase
MKDIPNLDPAILVIFGITGDLAKRKLLPALYSLMKEGLVPEPFEIMGITRQKVNLDDLLQDVELCINERDNVCDPEIVHKLKNSIQLFHMDVTNPGDYDQLLTALNAKEDHHGVCLNRLYYLSIPPQVFTPIVRLLGEHGHNASCQHGTASTRLLVEKPFGYDLSSAKELITDLGLAYDDNQVFRIDHYLAKETVQNILTFRFKNPLFKAVWGKQTVKRIIITAKETIGIEGRVAFYEQTGALRDLIQSHLLQLLALIIMDEPASLESSDIHAAKLAALQHIVPVAPDHVASQTVRGQYDGYPQEVDNPQTVTETYAEINLIVDDPKWAGVPICIKTGKALNEKLTQVTLVFGHDEQPENHLSIRLQPNEGITLGVQAKKPGLTNETREVNMNFDYREAFDSLHPDAYERVLIDAIRGDKTLFATCDEVLASWQIIEHIIGEWSKNDHQLLPYSVGSSGPVTS